MHAFAIDILSRPLGLKPTHLAVLGELAPSALDATRLELRQHRGAYTDDGGMTELLVRIDGPVATVEVRGMLVHRCGFWGWLFGCCDTATLAGALYALAENSRVETVVLDLDTPGGDIKGMDSVIAALAEIKAQGKRLIGSVSGNCHSCGAWILSQCQERFVGPTGIIGAIGVMVVLEDSSAMFAEHGVSRILVASTELKGVNVPGVGITDAQIAAEGSVVMSLHRRVVADVAAGCGVGEDMVEGWTESPDMVGAEAVDAGMATGMLVFEQVLQRVHADRPSIHGA